MYYIFKMCVCSIEESDRQLHLKNETIRDLRIRLSSLKSEKDLAVHRLEGKIASLRDENEQLRNQLLMKYETGESHKNLIMVLL